MKIIILNPKGGGTKSTTALILACTLNESGKAFDIIDLDPQKSLTSWVKRVGIEPTKGAKYEIIDTYPTLLGDDINKALKEADQIIIPSGTSIAESEVVANSIPTIKERTNGEIRVLWTKVRPNTRSGKNLDRLSEALPCKTFNAFIEYREEYQQEFLMYGWKGLKENAKKEAIAFTLELIA